MASHADLVTEAHRELRGCPECTGQPRRQIVFGSRPLLTAWPSKAVVGSDEVVGVVGVGGAPGGDKDERCAVRKSKALRHLAETEMQRDLLSLPKT